MIDPTLPHDLAAELREMKRRIGELERSNPLQRASTHDGTETRIELGEVTHPYSNPVGEDDFGMIVRSDEGVPVFMVDGGGALIPGTPGFLQALGPVNFRSHTSTSWTASWQYRFVGSLGGVFSTSLQITCGSGITAAEAKVVAFDGAIAGVDTDVDSSIIDLTCNGSAVSYTWHFNPGYDLDPNDVIRFQIQTRITGGSGTLSVTEPRWGVTRSVVAVDTNI